MTRFAHSLSIILTLFLTSTFLPAHAQMIDGTVATVGTRSILLSDVEMELVRAKMQEGIAPEVSSCAVLENLLIHHLLLDQADLDSLPSYDDGAAQEVDQRIAYFVQQLGSEQELERQYGRPLKDIKRDMQRLIGEQRRANQARSEVISKVHVTPSQVREFYRSQPKDSLPIVPESYIFRHLIMEPISSDEAEYQVRERLLELRERILKGERFSTLAVAYSEDRSSAVKGGEMGFLPRESFVKPFGDAAFALQEGQVSQIVKTEFGYHIIQMVGKRGNMVNVRHILMKPTYTTDVIQATIARLDSIRNLIAQDSISFELACLQFSDDKDSRLNGGLAVNQFTGGVAFEKETMIPVDYYAVRKLSPGEMSEPYESRDKLGNSIVKIVWLERMIPTHRMNLEEDYAELQELARKAREREVFAQWLHQKQEEIFLRIDSRYKDCNFELPFWRSKVASE